MSLLPSNTARVQCRGDRGNRRGACSQGSSHFKGGSWRQANSPWWKQIYRNPAGWEQRQCQLDTGLSHFRRGDLKWEKPQVRMSEPCLLHCYFSCLSPSSSASNHVEGSDPQDTEGEDLISVGLVQVKSLSLSGLICEVGMKQEGKRGKVKGS